ncbi:nuclear transport factor 2 family protein [Chryseobacterium sp. LC2016-27]|uniref:nuclear transport factor 2 family protein n=1 Tax=Chryseobacterium sp. LC2016-27 TaxID=2897326 RepID=UPI001E4D9E4E|nr:nuclear transport factor 2 family protein [Chryseobacterium sp. LC2016-27]MCD0456390.1 nuclear transport factor 2 family protein [Chryseobacterium sp. LC2016-27]
MKAEVIFIAGAIFFAVVSCNKSNEIQIKNKNNQSMQSTQAQKDGILQAIDLYAESGRLGDSKPAKQAFSETATMSWNENGELKSVPIQSLYDIFDSGDPGEASYELTTLNVEEDVAIVRIESQFGSVKYADMFTLVKEDDRWKIVSKVYHTKK